MKNELPKEMAFFIYLVQFYAVYKEKETGEVLKEWDNHNITQEIYNNYWGYHTESIENAFEDIDCLLMTGKHAW